MKPTALHIRDWELFEPCYRKGAAVQRYSGPLDWYRGLVHAGGTREALRAEFGELWAMAVVGVFDQMLQLSAIQVEARRGWLLDRWGRPLEGPREAVRTMSELDTLTSAQNGAPAARSEGDQSVSGARQSVSGARSGAHAHQTLAQALHSENPAITNACASVMLGYGWIRWRRLNFAHSVRTRSRPKSRSRAAEADPKAKAKAEGPTEHPEPNEPEPSAAASAAAVCALVDCRPAALLASLLVGTHTVERAMVSLGMTPRQASDFRGKYEITRERLIERLSWLCARRWSGERVHNDGGWIAKAFSDGYEAPPCYDAFRAAWTKRANELSATRSAS